jgi:hypothetical protein
MSVHLLKSNYTSGVSAAFSFDLNCAFWIFFSSSNKNAAVLSIRVSSVYILIMLKTSILLFITNRHESYEDVDISNSL